MVSTRAVRQVVAALVGAVVWGAASARPAAAQSVAQIDHVLSSWQMDLADTAIDKLAAADANPADVLYLRGRYDFFRGDYDTALHKVDRAIELGGKNPRWTRLRELIAATRQVTKDYVKYTSPQGRFEISVPRGKDQVMVPFAGEALERAYEAIGAELGYTPDTPIRVEVYPRTATLAKVSTLTESEIRTSGTIALCKYNRLMVTSPRSLLQGYAWVDTMVHEYVHYVINSKTHNSVPIWMHEGLAKFLERRWRGPDAQRLPPSNQSLLKRRVAADDLITFEQMHPSMAKLPSQEDAAVAFAEVYTVMEYLRKEVGADAFKTLLDAIDDGLDARQAFARTIGKPFSTFERQWTAYLKTRDMVDLPEDNGYDDKLHFKEENATKAEVNDIDQPQARDHKHLGEMLQGRKRWAAALVEYNKASHLLGQTNPVLQTRQAECLLHQHQPARALEVLGPVQQKYPGYLQAWIEMGKASLALGHYEAARDQLTEAARINPFDPEIHRKLAEAYQNLGDTDMAAKFKKFAKLVS